MMVLGPRLGTLVGTLEPMPMCALWAHVVSTLMAVKYFAWDDAKNAKFLRNGGRMPAVRMRKDLG